jgi:hypothetical protein
MASIYLIGSTAPESSEIYQSNWVTHLYQIPGIFLNLWIFEKWKLILNNLNEKY